jgi:transposase
MIIKEEILDRLSSIRDNGTTKQERHRAHALLLLNTGKSKNELAEIFEVSQRTIYNWINDFKADGIKSLAIQKGRGRKTLLNEGSDKKVISEFMRMYSHQPKKAYALSVEKLSIKMSYKTFKRYLKKNSI